MMAMPDHPRRAVRPRGRSLTLAVAVLLMLPALAAAQPAAATLYERVLLREASAREAAAPTLTTLRAIASSYEAIVRRYPRSGFADNALWQAAGVLQLAHARYGQPADQLRASGLLAWLKREYPHSSLAKRDLSPVQPELASGKDLAPISVTASAEAAASPPGSTSPLPPGGGAAVRAITHTPLPQGDRITIELTREVSYSADRLDAPDRIFVDLTQTAAAPALIEQTLASVSGRLVKSTRVGVRPDGTSRVVLDVTGKPRYSSFPLYNPFRLVIDVESEALPRVSVAVPPATLTVTAPPPATAPPREEARRPITPTAAPTTIAAATTSRPTAAAPSPPAPAVPEPPAPAAPAVTSRGEYSLARQLGLRISRVVIDPGHGGHDPGARANGLTEADLVLDVALRLETLLREEGVDVVLTRRSATFVPLEERTAIANRLGADMFVSIHANASPRTGTSGIETYFLNFATNEQAEALAARENASSAKTMGTLPSLLKAIALNNKLDESRELAAMVQSALVRAMSANRRSVKSLGVKQAPFVVLIGAQMPSILAEIGFITNRAEATALKLPAGREAVAQGLFDAILKYQAALKSEPAVASRR
jgi:N-acetylmuramoyl-L-alanine amidase